MLKKYDALPSCSQRCAAIKLGITQSTLSRLVPNREKISEDSTSNINPKRKRIRDGKDVAVENTLLQWFTNVPTQNASISRGILMEKPAILASKLGHEGFKPTDGWILMEKPAILASKLGHEGFKPTDGWLSRFKPTDGWLSRWKKRNNIVYKKLHGEIKDADSPAAESWIKTSLPELLRDFKPDKIYNTDETALYFRALSDYLRMNHMRRGKSKRSVLQFW
ncbi:hypothetical protein QE152_g13325 [Popillia japonica]|uniref:HTH CENPB-type domain-containing protein n=1 Tax=Popillia japonica TaxID=7064 RepID=A0AAW1LAG4_POPJA